jgi:hypothetical protein
MISAAIRVRVVRDSTGHAGQAKEMHGEEGDIYTNKERSEMNLR